MEKSSPVETKGWTHVRNVIAFWLCGLCNNFGYVIMLSAAQDILAKDDAREFTDHEEFCIQNTTIRTCSPVSAGVVSLCNILPCLIVKLAAPFCIHKFPYGVRHSVICIAIVLSFLVTAFSDSVGLALVGVLLTSFSSGIGENSFLGLSSHYPRSSIAAWSTGTGSAGIIGSLTYAGLTDHQLVGLSPSDTILCMMIVPLIFFIAFNFVLVSPDHVAKASITKPSSWIEMRTDLDKMEKGKPSSEKSIHHSTTLEKLVIMKGLIKYMAPVTLVYYAQYVINQGLVELTTFDCATGYNTSPRSQYRWYQVLYEIGVFLTKFSGSFVQLSLPVIFLLPALQFFNLGAFLVNSLHPFIPSFSVAAAIVFFEGLVGGAAYVHTFSHIHSNVEKNLREFALSTVSLSDGLGIFAASLTAIPLHNLICSLPYY